MENLQPIPLLLDDSNLNIALTVRKLRNVTDRKFIVRINQREHRHHPLIGLQEFMPESVIGLEYCNEYPPEEINPSSVNIYKLPENIGEFGGLPVKLDKLVLTGQNILPVLVKENLIIDNNSEINERSALFQYPRIVIFLVDNEKEMFWLAQVGNLNKVTHVYVITGTENRALGDKLSYFRNVHVVDKISWKRLYHLIEGADACIGHFSCATVLADMLHVPGTYYLPEYARNVVHEHWAISVNNDLRPTSDLGEIEYNCYEFVNKNKWENVTRVEKKEEFGSLSEFFKYLFRYFNKSCVLLVVESKIDPIVFKNLTHTLSENNVCLEMVDVTGNMLDNDQVVELIRAVNGYRVGSKIRFINLSELNQHGRNMIYDIVLVFTNRDHRNMGNLLSEFFLMTRATSKIVVKTNRQFSNKEISLESINGLQGWYILKR